MTKEIVEAVGVLEREKGISADRLMAALEDALLSAYKKTPEAAKYARVEVDRGSGDFRVYELILPPDLEDQLLDEVEEEAGEPTVDPETGEMVYPEPPEIDQERLMQYREQIEEHDVTPEDFGRIAAQTAKQVILQRIREAERDMMFTEYQDRVGELITGIVQQSDSRYTLVQLRERVEALLPRGEQVHGERYDHGQRIKAIITDVSNQAKGPSIIVSRRSPELIRSLFELEVPEIADGLVEIQNVAREPGYRSKIAVVSHASGVDPVGACVGPRGSRVRMVVSELRGEKIDIIPFNEEPARFVAKALSPARVREVLVDDEAKQATVIVPDDQLSLAIGKDGLNARLAARLTGWRVDIRSETEFAEEEATMGYAEEEVAGRCAAILANGKRCPNASLPGSRYCGIPAHQELVVQEGLHGAIPRIHDAPWPGFPADLTSIALVLATQARHLRLAWRTLGRRRQDALLGRLAGGVDELLEAGGREDEQQPRRTRLYGEAVGDVLRTEDERTRSGLYPLLPDLEGQLSLEDPETLVLAVVHVERSLALRFEHLDEGVVPASLLLRSLYGG
jgi:transcription termination/antitermination protein NusA